MREHPDTAVLRRDAYASLMAIAWVLARCADGTSMTSRPTWAVLIERSGRSRSTVALWLRWLRERGLLGTVTPGSSVRLREGTQCGAIDDGLGNIAAEYVLAVPGAPDDDVAVGEPRQAPARRSQKAVFFPVEESRTPSGFPSVGGEPSPRTRARGRWHPATHDHWLIIG
ncbi:helix-turn-helix domain-containing protein [Nonomuraea aurantiaca]|uniref:helix-turn-helix domain-containing protein n=1 Tax=Nonomuraea aurantiaca TaxID=2878562 RepID=UPI001CD94AD5|nr:helix-turn-helix domain-containing protein [Nonomuraea aurantiaca]MCA2230266.1 helix-turn-helix domain-containing protein [Nonomuraea aurantiaca]